MVKPISPKEIKAVKDLSIPDEVISAVNTLLVQAWDGTRAIIKLNAIIALAITNFSISNESMTREKLFETNALDFESLFRKEGWTVIFDKPSWDESYDAYFKFTKKGK